MGGLYANPFIDKFYKEAQENEPGVRRWPSMAKYMPIQFLGTQVEVYILAAAYVWLRPLVPLQGYSCALALGGLLAAVRIYPRFWNMWIQSTYPRRLLAIEFVNGVISTLVVTIFMEIFV